MNFHIVTWEQLEEDCLVLARKINESDKKLDEIVSITRGGMVVARILSDFLHLPISHIGLSSYKGLHQNEQPVVTQPSTRVFHGESILLVDELADSGKTFIAAVEYLHSLPIGSITTAAPYVKPYTIYTPEYWVENFDAWIVLPYELRETKESLMEEFGEEEGLNKFHELHIRDWEEKI